MPRPAVVIGVGGTGSWVLSWLKKDLIETFGSMHEIPVRLLLLDVADNIARVGAVGGNREGYSEYQSLDNHTEFLRLPTDDAGGTINTRRIEAQITQRRNEVDHLSEWFCGEGHFPILDLADGAGQFRQLGRLAFVQGLHMVGRADAIYQRLETMINEVAAGGHVDIHIVGSFAGGTGAGMFLDVAWLARMIAGRVGQNCFITGFFAMPSTFNPQPTDSMRTKAFAAWRELNRAMAVRRGGGNGFKIRWGTQPEMHYEVNEPAYDQIYLVDPVRAGNRLPGEAKNGTFPIIAEAISFMLDQISGTEYIQHIRQNLNSVRNSYPFRGRPTFSTLYVKTWKIPIYHQRAVYQHNFAKRFLEVLLGVESYTTPDTGGKAATSYRLRSQQAASIDQIFNEAFPDIGTTEFIDIVGTIRNIPSSDRDSGIIELANSAANLLTQYSQMPATPDGNAVTQQIAQKINWEVPSYDPNRIPRDQLRSYHDTLFGVDNRGGEIMTLFGDFAEDRSRGDLYESLAPVQSLHLNIFKARLRYWADRTLRQPQGLASLISALKQLQSDLKAVEEFMVKALEVQPKIKEVHTLYNNADTITQRGDGGVVGWLQRLVFGDPKKRAVIVWLESVRNSAHQRRNRRALQHMRETAGLIRDYVENTALLQASQMEKQLVQNNINTSEGIGLYRNIVASLGAENKQHQSDEALQQVMNLLGQARDIPPVNEDHITTLVRNTQWQIDESMRLTIEIKIDPNQPPIRLSANMEGADGARRLLDQILDEVARPFIPRLAEAANTALRMMDHNELRRQLPGCRATLFDAAAGGGAQDTWTFYIRAKGDNNELAALTQMVNQLGLTKLNQAVGIDSENAHKLVVFSAREVLLPEHFAEWERCQGRYQTMIIGDPNNNIPPNPRHVQCDHLFGAEKAALDFERLVSTDLNVRQRILPPNQRMLTLSSRVVQMLEFQSRIRDFLKIWIFGWAQIRDVGNDYVWTVSVGDMRPTDIAPRARTQDFLSVFLSYSNGQNPQMQGFDYRLAHQLVDRKWDEMRRAEGMSLQQRCEFELHACGIMDNLREPIDNLLAPHSRATLTGVIPVANFNGVRANNIQRFLNRQDLTDEIRARAQNYTQNYQNAPPLAHLFAEDFTYTADNGVDPRITDAEAHRQMVEVILHFMLKEFIAGLAGLQQMPHQR